MTRGNYNPADCDKVRELGTQGMILTEAAKALGIGHQTFAAWERRHPEWKAAAAGVRKNSAAFAEMKWQNMLDRDEDRLERALAHVRAKKAKLLSDYREGKVSRGQPQTRQPTPALPSATSTPIAPVRGDLDTFVSTSGPIQLASPPPVRMGRDGKPYTLPRRPPGWQPPKPGRDPDDDDDDRPQKRQLRSNAAASSGPAQQLVEVTVINWNDIAKAKGVA